ncbi:MULTISPECIES: sodium-dependent transporter [Bacillota]|uniref:Transporter n=2 Tax=Amedibacillus TaxID=2749846 RepID=A0A7G9GMP5_9FIRM|nr:MULTISPECIES: sodium-dependent transporter [Bacillota]QNM12077.1 sodium-dependent transporter [[Eubacterium] hominis]MCH4286570.1 sodium-dependent transporter [Amedibacillus hominis]RGB53143.1 sodium-dependent transporter [Absiella sp. AM22-9]RGB59433.1 sodium-dependent transporter [Absiella sp. AM10-20]RGB66594.1 sodium-dependent transporter [Absiella sp. AM09-45]
MEQKREKLSSRIGFIFLSAGCAIGLGNIWRFPYVTGKYGGGAFVLVYLFFLIILGLPIMVMEFSVGRASRQSVAKSFQVLEPKGKKWHLFSYMAMLGNYLLVMFYTTISGWMLAYFVKMASGEFNGMSTQAVTQTFVDLQQNPAASVFWMILVVCIGCFVCVLGLQNGVEKITKVMMSLLLGVMIVLVLKSLSLPGAMEGIKFYLIPDFEQLMKNGIFNAVYTAMGQAFFTLSIGMGGMAIFGSYIDKKRSLSGESLNIMILDTFVAIMAGFIIFPACMSFGVDAGSGPGLVFVTLPNIFNAMSNGRIWGSLFFIFMNFAALSTIIAVFENIISFGIDLFGFTRRKSVLINLLIIIAGSIPCALGFSVLSGFQPFGEGSAVLDLLDFMVSNVIMPIGSIVFLFFCTRRYGWGWKAFINEANAGEGLRFPEKTRYYVSYILPLIVVFIFLFGLWEKLFA